MEAASEIERGVAESWMPLLDAFSHPAGLLSREGAIVSVNAMWRSQEAGHGFAGPEFPSDARYAAVCRGLTRHGTDSAERIIDGLRRIESGKADTIYLEAQRGDNWFGLRFTRLRSDPPLILVMQEEITERVRLERVFEEEEAAHRFLRAIAEITDSPADPSDALQVILGRVRRFVGWPLVHLYLLSDADDELAPSGIWSLDEPERWKPFQNVTAVTRFAPGVGMPGRILENGELLWIPDVQQDSNFQRVRVAREMGIHAGFGIPIKIEGDVAGVLECFTTDIVPPDLQRIETLSAAGMMIGRILERQRTNDKRIKAEAAITALHESLQHSQGYPAEADHHLQTLLGALNNLEPHLNRRDPLIRGQVAQMRKAADRIAGILLKASQGGRIPTNRDG